MATIVAREENAYTLGVQAGFWGYPLAHRIETWPVALEVKGAGLNSLQKFDRLKTADDRFVVTPNNLTIDAYALMDLTHGPVVIAVPTFSEPRWFIVQIGDAFDDVVQNIGGNRAAMPGVYLITGLDFQGRVPGDMGHVQLRTKCGFVGVRIAVFGSADLPIALREQQGFKMMPLREYLDHGIAYDQVDYGPLTFPKLTAPPELALFDRIGAAMQYMLPTSLDVNDTFVQALAGIGLSVRKGFDLRSLDGATTAGLLRAVPVIDQIIDERWASIGETVNGWRGAKAAGRCSYDFALNAANTKNQVGTELAEQVVYVNCRVDANGDPFDGANNYVLHFEPGQTPPVAGMWNLAMYDNAMFFVHNEANRFTIGSTTDGVTKNPDESLTIYIQHAKPDGDKSANWLPAPQGSFNLTMRFYAPLSPVLDKSYTLPVVRKQ